MGWELNSEDTQYVRSIESFAKAELAYDPRPFQEGGRINKTAWEKCADFGILGGLVPLAYGGGAKSLTAYVAGMQALGRHCLDSGLLFAICAHVFACVMPLSIYGSQDQKEKWLRRLCQGSAVAAIAIAEEQGASDAFGMTTTASAKDGGVVLNGEKTYVTNAPFCDVVFAYAVLKDKPGNIAVCIVERGAAGVSFSEPVKKMGLGSAPFGRIVFTDCFVAPESVLSRKDNGKMIFMNAMEWERGCILAPVVGVMERQLEGCVGYLKARTQGGVPLSKKQVLSHRVVDMRMRLELSQLILCNYVKKKEKDRRAHIEASMAKLYISESFLQNSLDAVQLHGAFGYTERLEYESLLRDSIGVRIASGTSDIQKEIIAHSLRLT